MDKETPGNPTTEDNLAAIEFKISTKRKATDSGDEPQVVDFQFMYNYMKSIESQLYELGQENKRLHERLGYMESKQHGKRCC